MSTLLSPMSTLLSMSSFRHWQAAWGCARCRRYRKLALACAAAAVCVLFIR